jgi:hypothetical protein
MKRFEINLAHLGPTMLQMEIERVTVTLGVYEIKPDT